MKKHPFLCLFLLAVLLCTVLTGCTSAEDSAHAEAQTKAVIDALIADDYATVYALLQGVTTEEEFKAFYEQAVALFQNVTDYELTEVGTRVHFSLQNSYYQKTYHLMIENQVAAEINTSFFKKDGSMRGFFINIPQSESTTDVAAAM